jgi:hypothetical protein
MYYYILFLTVIAIIAIYYLLYLYATQVTNVTQATKATINVKANYYMSAQETSDFLSTDRDKYVYNLSPLDLHARNVSSASEYINNITQTAISFTQIEKDMLDICTKKADNFIRNTQLNELIYGEHINRNDIANINWIFAKTHNVDTKEYEEGLPHTRDNVIFLSDNVLKYEENNLITTLIHEKIHIYQRYNEELFKKIIDIMGLVEVSENHNTKKYMRSNPDTNRNIYIDNKTNNVMVCLYRTDKPSNINDVIMKNHSLEHPYEKIAYEIADYYNKTTADKYKNI